jgi:hypothetical protein
MKTLLSTVAALALFAAAGPVAAQTTPGAAGANHMSTGAPIPPPPSASTPSNSGSSTGDTDMTIHDSTLSGNDATSGSSMPSDEMSGTSQRHIHRTQHARAHSTASNAEEEAQTERLNQQELQRSQGGGSGSSSGSSRQMSPSDAGNANRTEMNPGSSSIPNTGTGPNR